MIMYLGDRESMEGSTAWGEGFLSFSAKKSDKGVEGLQHNKVGKMCISIHVSVLKIPHL